MKLNRPTIVLPLLFGSALFGQAPGGAPYQYPNLHPERRAVDLVSRMTLEEKVLQMQNSAPAIPRLGVPVYNWWNEALHGVATGRATVFPQAIGLGATWDADLVHRVADAISTEARAKYHEAQRRPPVTEVGPGAAPGRVLGSIIALWSANGTCVNSHLSLSLSKLAQPPSLPCMPSTQRMPRRMAADFSRSNRRATRFKRHQHHDRVVHVGIKFVVILEEPAADGLVRLGVAVALGVFDAPVAGPADFFVQQPACRRLQGGMVGGQTRIRAGR